MTPRPLMAVPVVMLALLSALATAQPPMVLGTIAGSPYGGFVDGFGREARFQSPAGMTLGGDTLYVADSANHAIRAVDTSTGEVTTVAGTGSPGFVDGPVATATLNTPRDVLYDPSSNSLLVADSANNAIRQIDLSAGEVSTYAGTGVAGWYDGYSYEAQFNEPSGLCFAYFSVGAAQKSDDPRQYGPAVVVADTGNHCLREIYDMGGYSPGGEADKGITPGTRFVATLCGQPGNPGFNNARADLAQFNRPVGLMQSDGFTILIADSGNHAIRAFDTYGWSVITIQGDGTPGDENSPGSGGVARFNTPLGVGMGADGGVWIGDSENFRVRTLDPYSTAVGTVVGSVLGYVDAPLPFALLNHPWDVAADETQRDSGRAGAKPVAFISDHWNNCIRAIGENTPPVARTGGPYTVGPGESLLLDGSKSFDPDVLLGDHITDWAWDLNNDGGYDRNGETLLLSPFDVWWYFGDDRAGLTYPYNRRIVLQVMDVFWATDTASTLVTVTGDLAANLRPTLLPEPPWTKGTENRLDWTGVEGATAYELEWSRGNNFGVIAGSLVTPDLTGLATGLSHNVTYHYRVRGFFGRIPDGADGKYPGLPGPWSNVESSTQDARAPGSAFTALSDPLRSNMARTRLPWTSTESGSGFANMSLWYSFEGSVLTRYPGRWQADSIAALAGENEEQATGTLLFDVAQAAGDGSYELWLSGRDNVTNDEATTGYRDLRLIVDSTPPQITDIVVSNITTTTADISWKTSERCTCELTYGETTKDARKLSTGPGKNHQVQLTGLTPDTEYRFEITATDDFGNTAKSDPQTFRTLRPAPPVISNIQVTNITKDSADISWDTDKPTTGLVDYGKTTAYGSQVSDPTWATSHIVHLTGLGWGTLYHFEITATDDYGSTAKSGDQTFTTVQPPPPVISNIQVTNIQRDSADISWDTDKLTTGVVYYGTTISYGSQVSDPTLSKKHQVHLSGLPWGTLHHFRIAATDQLGLSGWSPDGTFTTLQPAPPVISDIRVTNITKDSADISWVTDKLTTGLVDYGTTAAYGSQKADAALSKTHHVHLTGLTPETKHHFRITATDQIPLSSQSGDQTLSTPPGRPEAPVLDPEPEFTKGTSNHLSWSAAQWAVKYRLEVAQDAAFTSPLVVETAARNTTVDNLTDGAKYYYRVAGVNSANVQGLYSNVEHSTQDASPPETSCALVSAPTAAPPGTYVELRLQGSDASSGVQYILLYYAKDRGPWEQYPGRRAPGDHVRFDLSKLGGGHYAFYTIGVDNVGNREAPPATPDVEVDVRVPTVLTYAGDYGTTTGQDALIAAVLTDAFGKPISGATVNYTLGSLSGALPATNGGGLAQAVINVPLAPGAYDLTLTYAGTITLAPCSTKIVFVVKPVVPPPGPRVDVVGQGKVVDPAGAQYAFNTSVSSNPLGGTVRVTVGTKVIRATSITSVSAVGNVATVTGIATIGGVPGYRFVIRVTDGAPDQFGLTATDGTYVGLTDLSAGSVTITSTP